MEPGAALFEALILILGGASSDSEAGAAADAVETFRVVADDVRKPHERQQAAVERDAGLVIGDRDVDMGDAVDFHRNPSARCDYFCFLTLTLSRWTRES